MGLHTCSPSTLAGWGERLQLQAYLGQFRDLGYLCIKIKKEIGICIKALDWPFSTKKERWGVNFLWIATINIQLRKNKINIVSIIVWSGTIVTERKKRGALKVLNIFRILNSDRDFCMDSVCKTSWTGLLTCFCMCIIL